jgi:hypothetical protein
MVKYQCIKCKKEYTKKSTYENHLERKYSCVSMDNVYSCEYCGYQCEREWILNRHIKYGCSIKKDIDRSYETECNLINLDVKKDEIRELKEKIKQLEELIMIHRPNITNTNSNNTSKSTMINSNNTANITSNQTINNKLTIVNFGKENIDKLSDDDKKEILNSCYGAILRCAKKVNFNPEFPEQRNIFLTNPKAEFAYKYEMNKYEAIETNDLLDQIIYHRASDVRDLIEQNDVLKIADSKIERVNKLLKNIDNEKKEDIAYIKKDLRLILFNENMNALANKKKYDEITKVIKKKIIKE